MPTLTNAQVIEALGALRQLAQERVPVAGALRMRQVIRALQARFEDVEAERKKLLEQHADKDAKGDLLVKANAYQFADDEARQAFEAGYRELMAAEWEHGYGIREKDLGSIEVSTAVLLQLGPLLED